MKHGMNSNEMQKTNRMLVFKMLQDKGSMMRTDLAKEIGLQKATITNIINGFLELGIVAVDGETASGRRGEKIYLKLDGIYIMSAGITRQDYQIGIFSMYGEQVRSVHYKFGKNENIFSIVHKMQASALELLNEYGRQKVIGVCLAVPGIFIKIPEDGSEIFSISEFEEMSKIDIRKEMEEVLGLPIWIKHDSKLSAYAEWKNAKEAQNNDKVSLVVVRSRGYGIGAGIVINGKIIEGRLGIAGEVGYSGINYNGKRARDSREGTFEYCAGIESAVRYMKERLFEFPESQLTEDSSYQEILQAYENGDELAVWVMNKLAWMLGYGLTNIIYMINPDCIILGADYPDSECFLEKVRESVKEHVPEIIRDYTTIRYSELNEDSFLLGGYYYALEQLYKGDILEKIRLALGADEA